MAPDIWEAALAAGQPWQSAYAHVEREAKALLDTFGNTSRLTTTELVERLYAGTDQNTRKRMFKALRALADHGLAAYVTRGEPERIGKVAAARRLLWGAPGAIVVSHVCPTCKRAL